MEWNKAIIKSEFPNELLSAKYCKLREQNRYKTMSIIGLVLGIRVKHNRNFKKHNVHVPNPHPIPTYLQGMVGGA